MAILGGKGGHKELIFTEFLYVKQHFLDRKGEHRELMFAGIMYFLAEKRDIRNLFKFLGRKLRGWIKFCQTLNISYL